MDGEPCAAIEVWSGVAIADPFQPTAEAVELLHLRARRLRGDHRRARRGLWLCSRAALRAA